MVYCIDLNREEKTSWRVFFFWGGFWGPKKDEKKRENPRWIFVGGGMIWGIEQGGFHLTLLVFFHHLKSNNHLIVSAYSLCAQH